MDSGDSGAAEETRLTDDEIDWEKYPKKISISSRAFYANFHGHKLHYCVALHRLLRPRKIIWFAGDSSLDNKHWLYPADDKFADPLKDDTFTAPACNGYENILTDPARCVRDVCYWVNEAASASGEYVCINTSVEASTLKDRMTGLLGHDLLIRDKLQPDDVLVVSIGGNDIALRPSLKTMASVSWLAFFSGENNIASGSAYGMGHVKRLFHDNVKRYVEELTSKCRPKKVLVCMIYYPCEEGEGWADPLLNLLGYSGQNEGGGRTKKIQQILDVAFREATSAIEIEGTEVVPVQLSRVLDSANGEHYENRVEPSVLGGMLMGQTFYDLIQRTEPVLDADFQSVAIADETDNGRKKKKKKKKAVE